MSPVGSSPRKERSLLPKFDDVDDDLHSTLSHNSGIPRAEHAFDTLRLVAGNRVRHALCPPEFLEEMAAKGVQTSLKKSPHRKFKIIHGSDARSHFKNYVRDHSSRNDNNELTKERMPSPIVFAVTVWEGETKCVDYYMTWRGKRHEAHGDEYERQVTHLDSHFRKLARGLDKEYKSISSLRTFGNLAQPPRKFDKKSYRHKSRAPTGIAVSVAEDATPLPAQQPLPEPPASASDSVMSLPLLNMIRGVPLSHRVPLRVTNPDRLSVISDITIIPDGIVDEKSQRKLEPSNHNLVPTGNHSLKRLAVQEKVKASSASIRSSDTNSSKSSRSSRSSTLYSSENSRNTSPERNQRDIPEYLIVLLGDKFSADSTSWHGLDRQTSVRSLPADRHSTWMGPVASSKSISRRNSPVNTPNASDSEGTDDETAWKHTPVIPMKPFIEAMGFAPSSNYYHPPAVVPGGLQYQLSVANAKTPMPGQSPYLYSSPRMEASSPYVPAWIPPLPPSTLPSRPASRTSYASPYMQAHTNPF